jgi:pimeloyl-ACP methyl ester carboxylesterase
MAKRWRERLGRRFRVVCVRYVAGGEDTLECLAASLAARLREVCDSSPALIGESFGSMIVIQTALSFPAVVAAAGLVNGFAHYPRPWRLALARWGSAMMGQRGCLWFRRRHGAKRLLGPRWRMDLAREIEAHKPEFDELYRKRLELIARVDLRPGLAKLVRPFTLFASDSDRIVPAVTCAREMAAKIPDAKLCVIRQAGHSVLGLEE